MSRYNQRYRILSIYYSPAVTNYLYNQYIIHRTTNIKRHRLSCGLLPPVTPKVPHICHLSLCVMRGRRCFDRQLLMKVQNCNVRAADMRICKRVPASINKVVCPLSRKDNVIKVRKMALSPRNKTGHCR